MTDLKAETTTETTPARNDAAPALSPEQLTEAVHAITDRARAASRILGRANRARKDRLLLAIADALVARRDVVLAANRTDVERGRAAGTSDYLLDRLSLDSERVDRLAEALAQLAALPDPVGTAVRAETLPNGLRMRQV